MPSATCKCGRETNSAVSSYWHTNAIGFAKFRSRSHDAVICVYDEAGNVIETHEHAGEFEGSEFVFASENGAAAINGPCRSSPP